MSNEIELLIDTGHRPSTPGKRSPDGRLEEWKWAKHCGDELERLAKVSGIAVWRVPQYDGVGEVVDLKRRIVAANAHAKASSRPCVLISIHVDAMGNGSEWMRARGWSVFVAPNASDRSKLLAEAVFAQARQAGFRVRQQQINVGYWVKSLAIVRDTSMPAILVENFFQDNLEDCEWLLREDTPLRCAEVMMEGLRYYMR